ncbi:MAG: polysaccharide deacetylase family protein [Phycisphaerae bacterium]|nr:polysaccharide deacetylase family protein [Phycisphaerae bacterium]
MTCQSKERGTPTAAAGMSHILTFDVEEYFQVQAAADGGTRREQWGSFERRLAPCVERILRLLSDHGASATFFVLGWVARHERDVVRTIAEAGQEIASHGMTHAMLGRLTPEQFRRELLDSRHLLEDISGRSVVGFRAPTFSVTHKTAWAIDVLAEAGYKYDSSVFPIRHDRYGAPDAPRFVHRAVGPGGGEILEIPPLTLRIMGTNWPVGGGGYLRLLPVRLVAAVLEAAQKLGQSGMIYLHPWELDPHQPILPMSRFARRRHRVNLKRTEQKLRRLLRDFRFLGVSQSMRTLAANAIQTHSYGSPGQS